MGLFSAIGGIAGAALGSTIAPGIGTQIGASLGSALGGKIGGGDSRPPGAPGSATMGGAPYEYQTYSREKTLPDYLQKPYQDTVSAVMAAGQEPFKPYEYQFRPELFAPDEIRAQELYRQIPDKYQPQIAGGLGVVDEMQRMALGGPNQQLLQSYMNPFIENVLDVQKARSLQDYQMRQRELSQQAGQVGSFGGSRFGIAQSQLADDYGLRTQELESQMLMAGYDRALGGLERGLERAAGLGTQALGGLQGIDLQGIKALDISGEKQYLRDFGEFMREVSDPMLKASFLSQNIQPLAATMAGERGTSLTYRDPNLGTAGEGLAFGSGLRGLGIGGEGGLAAGIFGPQIGSGMMQAGSFLGGLSGGKLGGSLFGRGTGIAAGLDPSQVLRMAKGGAQGKYGPAFNRGGQITGYQEGGMIDPYQMYLSAAGAGPGFVSPTPFSAWPDSPAGLALAAAGKDGEGKSPAGGLLGVLDRLKDKTEEDTEKTDVEGLVSKDGVEDESGMKSPGWQNKDMSYETFGQLFNLALGAAMNNEGGKIEKKKVRLTKEEADKFYEYIQEEDYDAIAESLNDKMPPGEKMTGEEVYKMLRLFPKVPVVPAPSDEVPTPPRKPQGLQQFEKGGQVEGEQEDERSLLEKGLSGIKNMNMVQAAGLGLATPTVLSGLGNLGYHGLKWALPKVAKYGPKAIKASLGTTKGQVATGLGSFAIASLFEGAKQQEDLLKATEETEKQIEDLKQEAAKARAPAATANTLTLPQSDSLRGNLEKTIKTSKSEEGVNRAALLAFGASLTQGGGLMYAFPRAAKAYSDAIASQEASAFDKQMQLMEYQNDVYQKETNRMTAEATVALAQLQAQLAPLKARTEKLKAERALLGEGADLGDIIEFAKLVSDPVTMKSLQRSEAPEVYNRVLKESKKLSPYQGFEIVEE